MNQEVKTFPTQKKNPIKAVKAPFLQLQTRISNSRSAYLAYCFIIPLAVMYLIYLAMEIHPFGNGSVLVLDLNGQYVYFFEALRNAVYGDGSLLYSFGRALGGEFVGIYAYYIASPLSYIVALFPQDRMLEALLTIILLKTGLCGFSFGYYLHKNSKVHNKLATVAFSLMYAMCAFAVVHQNNTMWIDAMIWLPLLVLGIEQLIKRRKYKLYVISLAMILLSNYYIGYMVCIFSVAYFVYYSFAHSAKETNLTGEKAHRLVSFARFGIFSVIAALIAGFILLGAYYSLTFGKSDFSQPNWSFAANFDLLDFFTKLLPGSYDTVRPEGLPFVYCGLLVLLLVPVYFMSKKISSREKVASVLMIAFFLLSFIIRPLDLVWHGFSRPNWLNYRYSFMLCFFLLVLAYKGMGNLRHVGEKFILGASAILILLTAVCQKQEFETYIKSDKKILTLETVWLTVLVTIAFLILLCLLIRLKHPKKRENVMAVLAAVVCIEIFCSSLTCVVQFDKDVIYSKYDGYNTFLGNLRPVVSQIQEQDQGFYRMEKLVHRKTNDNMALGMKGLSNSTSTLNANTIAFLKKLGYDSKSHASQYRGGTPVCDSLLGIKYLVDSASSEQLDHLYEVVASDENYKAYWNDKALSIAYGVDDDLLDFKLDDHYAFFDRINALVTAMLGEDETVSIFKRTYYNFSYQNLSDKNSTSSRYVLTSSAANSGKVTYQLVAPRSGELYFYAPGYYTSATGALTGASMYVNGNWLDGFFGNSTNRIISLGYFEQGEEVSVTLTLRGANDSMTLYKGQTAIWSMDPAVYEQAFAQLQAQPQFMVDDGCSDDHLTGSIHTTKEQQIIQTTIPYDEGWKVYLNGQELPIFETLDSLVAFTIPYAGEHTLELRYRPDIYTVGWIMSISGILIFIYLCIMELVWKKTVLKQRFQKVSDTLLWDLEDFELEDEAFRQLPPPEKKKKNSFFQSLFSKKKDTADTQQEAAEQHPIVPKEPPVTGDSHEEPRAPKHDENGGQ